MKHFILSVLAFILPFSLSDSNENLIANEQLIVFVQEKDTPVSNNFRNQIFPQLKGLAADEKIDVSIEYVIKDKAPKEVTYTPYIAFRDNRGISYFSGRWNQVSKVKNFIRSSRVIHQLKAKNPKENILAWTSGRLQLFAPLKITGLGGKLPKKYQSTLFMEEALDAVELGTEQFNTVLSADANLSTRRFYWAMYPFRGDDGTYYISGEIYSQYNCIDPVFTLFDNPVSDKNCAKAFQKMASLLEKETMKQLQNPENGDGFDIVDNTVEDLAWEKFGEINLDEADKNEVDWESFEFKKKWSVSGAFAENTPMAFFKFQQPLDGYTGEITALEGTIKLEKEQDIRTSIGQFSIPITSITMGDKGLDKAIHSYILDGEKYPEARFSFEGMDDVLGNLKGGAKTSFSTQGKMNLNGKTANITANGNIAPYIKDGKSYLNIRLKFGLNKSVFGVEKGPDGPEDIREQMEFYMNFLMD